MCLLDMPANQMHVEKGPQINAPQKSSQDLPQYITCLGISFAWFSRDIVLAFLAYGLALDRPPWLARTRILPEACGSE